MATFKFLWNGIKVDNGKLQRGSYSIGNLIGHPEATITIYARNYSGFSAAVWEAFDVQNDSDGMTDYFETDRIRVRPDHPLYSQVVKAAEAAHAHSDKMQAKREQRWAERRLAAA
jgi:hypothetical protein